MKMTKEEAIAQIEKLKSYCEYMKDSDENGAYVFDLDVQALNFALSVLHPIAKEQVEKVFPRCDFCKIELDDYPYIVARGDYDSSDTCYELSFCPICGKPLTDKAVDMVMERLEALGYSKDD